MRRSSAPFVAFCVAAGVWLLAAGQAHPVCEQTGSAAVQRGQLGLDNALVGEWCDTHLVWTKKAEALHGRIVREECPSEGRRNEPTRAIHPWDPEKT